MGRIKLTFWCTLIRNAKEFSTFAKLTRLAFESEIRCMVCFLGSMKMNPQGAVDLVDIFMPKTSNSLHPKLFLIHYSFSAHIMYDCLPSTTWIGNATCFMWQYNYISSFIIITWQFTKWYLHVSCNFSGCITFLGMDEGEEGRSGRYEHRYHWLRWYVQLYPMCTCTQQNNYPISFLMIMHRITLVHETLEV